MIDLRTLGSLELRASDGHEVSSVLAQPKRVAVLVYLAIATPNAWHRRDELLALFWPELDAEHARTALRQAVHFLRRGFGEDVIATRGEEDLGLAPGALRSDVATFDRAVAAGRLEEAMELYRGDLLPGFFISGSPEFEQWLDGERVRLRDAASASARALLARCEAAGDMAAAASWARRALRLAPLDEAAARRLIMLLDRLGERSTAVQFYEEFAARLAHELDVAPAPETVALIAAVRARQGTQAGAEAPAEALAAPRKKRVLRSGLAVAVGLAAVAAVLSMRASLDSPVNARRVVVAPFENRTRDSSLTQLGDLTAQWIARSLIGTGLVDVADPSATDPEGASPLRPGAAASVHALAQASLAGTAVSGSIYRRGDSLVFDAEITDERQNQLIRALGPVVAPLRDPRPAIATLSQRVVGTLAAASDPKVADAVTLASQPPSYQAYRLFAAGVAASTRLATLRASLQAFYSAAAADSTFTLPLVWAAVQHRTLNECGKVDSLARVLGRRAQDLPRLEQWYLDREVAQCRGDLAAAYRISRDIVAALPGSELSAELAGRAALGVNRPREAIGILARVHPDRDPEAARAGFFYLWLTASYHLLGRHRQELAAARRFRLQDPDRRLGMVRDELFALAALGRVSDVERALDEIPSFPPHINWKPAGVMRETGVELRVHGYRDASRIVFERAIAWLDSRPPEAQAADSLRFERLMTLYAAERWEDAGTLGAELARAHPDSVSYQGLVGAIAASRGDERLAARADSALVALWRPASHGLATYWRACIAARRGDRARAVALLQQAQAEGLQARAFPVRWGVYGFLYYDYLHRDPSFEAMHDYPPFRELLRPKG